MSKYAPKVDLCETMTLDRGRGIFDASLEGSPFELRSKDTFPALKPSYGSVDDLLNEVNTGGVKRLVLFKLDAPGKIDRRLRLGVELLALQPGDFGSSVQAQVLLLSPQTYGAMQGQPAVGVRVELAGVVDWSNPVDDELADLYASIFNTAKRLTNSGVVSDTGILEARTGVGLKSKGGRLDVNDCWEQTTHVGLLFKTDSSIDGTDAVTVMCVASATR